MSTQPGAEATRAKRRVREERVRSRVLEAAEREFAEAGYENARMHAIAERAGVALGTLYGSFPGKYELFEAVHARRLEELFVEVGASVAGSDRAIDAIARGLRAFAAFFASRPEYLAMHLREGLAWSSAETMRTAIQRDSWARGYEMMRAMFAAAQAEGSIPAGDPELQAQLAIAMQQVFLARWLDRSPRESTDALFESIWATLERAFAIARPMSVEG